MSRNQGTRSAGSITALESRENVTEETVDSSNDDVFVANSQSQPIHTSSKSRTSNSNGRATPAANAKDGKQPDFYGLSLKERISSMFMNEELADVHFLVGGEGEQMRFAAHRYILALGSCVFRAMLYGDLSNESRTFEIRIPDIEPRAFYFVLRYLYTDEAEVEAACAASIYYAAKKYLIDRLAAACVRVFEEDLVHSNACALLANALLFDETALADKCLRLVDAQAELVLASEAFRTADRHIVSTVLERDSLVVPTELVVFMALQRWATAECERKGVQCTTENQRAALDGSLAQSNRDCASSLPSNELEKRENKDSLLYKVRLPCIELQDYANVVVPSGLLTLKEVSDIFMYQVAARKPAVSFGAMPRPGLPVRRCSRFQSCEHRRNQWRYSRGKCDAVAFTVDKPIYLFAVGLYGSSGGSCEYAVRVEVKQQSKPIAIPTRSGLKAESKVARASCSDMFACSESTCCNTANVASTPPNAIASSAVHSNLIVHSTHASVTINNPIFGTQTQNVANFSLLLQHVTKLRSDGSSNVFEVRFPHALQIAADALYHVSVVLDGAELSFFGQDGLADVQCDDVTFQFHCSPDSTNGTGVQGGQIPALFFYM